MAKTQKVEIQGRASTGMGCRQKSVSELGLGTRFGAELCPYHELLIPPTALLFPCRFCPAPCLHMCLARARPGPISRPGAAPKTNMDADRSFASAPQLYLTSSRKSLWFNTVYFPLPSAPKCRALRAAMITRRASLTNALTPSLRLAPASVVR